MLGQAKWVAQVLSGRAALPTRADMDADTAAFYGMLQRAGMPVRYTHCQARALPAHLPWLVPLCCLRSGDELRSIAAASRCCCGAQQLGLTRCLYWHHGLHCAASG